MVSLTSIFKTTELLNLTLRELKINNNEVVGNSSKIDDKNLFKSKKLKNIKFEIFMQINIGAMGELTFLIFGTKDAFN